jgi:hypothetical protein
MQTSEQIDLEATYRELVLVYDLLESALEIAVQAFVNQTPPIPLLDQQAFWQRWHKLDALLWPDGDGGLHEWLLTPADEVPTDCPTIDRRSHFEGLRRAACVEGD